MRGLPLLVAARGFVIGPKVPIRRDPEKLLVNGLEEPGEIMIFGLKDGYESTEVARITTNGTFKLFPDDYYRCTELWAELRSESLEGVYVWVE